MRWYSTGFIAIALSGFSSMPLFAQEKKREPSNDTAPLEKRIAELEAKIAPLQKELQNLRKELHERSPITVVPVKFIDPVQAAEILDQVYTDTPGVLFEALPKMKCVAIRADKATTAEIRDLLRRLDEATRSPFGGPARLHDPERTKLLFRMYGARNAIRANKSK